MLAPDTLPQSAQDGAGPAGRSEGGRPFSPGPWRSEGIFVVRDVLRMPWQIRPGTTHVEIVADCGYERDTPRAWQEANACLIAAAPDLLAACRAALEVVAESSAEEDDLVWHQLRAQLQLAIERATEGGQ